MRKILFVFLALVISCSKREVEYNLLVERNGVMYEVNKDKPFSGNVFDKYKNQQLRLTGSFDSGLKTGVWKYFEKNGQIIEKSNFSKGKLNGLFEVFNEKNIITKSKNYKNGKLDGKYQIFDDLGKLLEAKNYKDGELDGKFIIYNKEGDIEEEGSYMKGEKIGLWSRYVYGEVEQKNYKNGKLEGEYRKINGQRVILQGNYKDDKKVGKWVSMYDHQDKIFQDFNYDEKGTLISFKEFDRDGKIVIERTYPGLSKWYKNGKKVAEGYFTDEYNYELRSFKFWLNNKKIDIETLLKYKWRGRAITGNGGDGYLYHYFHRSFTSNNYEYSCLSLIDHYSGRRYVSSHSSGVLKLDVNMLPEFYINLGEIRSEPYRYSYLLITNWNENSIDINGNTCQKMLKNENYDLDNK